MKHRPKDVKIKGQVMRKCRRCSLLWPTEFEKLAMNEKCPGRKR